MPLLGDCTCCATPPFTTTGCLIYQGFLLLLHPCYSFPYWWVLFCSVFCWFWGILKSFGIKHQLSLWFWEFCLLSMDLIWLPGAINIRLIPGCQYFHPHPSASKNQRLFTKIQTHMLISRQNINADAKHMGSGLAATIFPTVQLQVLSLTIWTIPNVKLNTFTTVI